VRHLNLRPNCAPGREQSMHPPCKPVSGPNAGAAKAANLQSGFQYPARLFQVRWLPAPPLHIPGRTSVGSALRQRCLSVAARRRRASAHR
jgi:hypothetical protein